uniref:Uncharacterized protein n=1 Tax=Oryza barthii TaxID=65489 RepID=A0A0D3EM80_9ORYZ
MWEKWPQGAMREASGGRSGDARMQTVGGKRARQRLAGGGAERFGRGGGGGRQARSSSSNLRARETRREAAHGAPARERSGAQRVDGGGSGLI